MSNFALTAMNAMLQEANIREANARVEVLALRAQVAELETALKAAPPAKKAKP